MSTTFTKLFSSITESTVWCEPAHTRLVWITMLAMADRRGRVWASIPGLANRARVPLEDAEKALATFLAPDRYSRTPDNEGRRIEPIDGGWQLLNHAKYREMRDDEVRREYQREWDRKNRPTRNPTDSDKSDKSRPRTTKAEAEAEAKVKSNVGLKPDAARQGNSELRKTAAEVIGFLNAKAGRNFDINGANADHVVARLKDGATVDDCRAVIALKCRQWTGDPKLAVYLRPETLFNRTKFASYKGELGAPEPERRVAI